MNLTQGKTVLKKESDYSDEAIKKILKIQERGPGEQCPECSGKITDPMVVRSALSADGLAVSDA